MTQEVVALTLEDIMPLRVKVLRKGTPVTHCNYPEDTYEDVIHLGVKNESTVVGTSSWFRKECPDLVGEAALQLKGMAVDDSLQGSGIGVQIIAAGLALATERGVSTNSGSSGRILKASDRRCRASLRHFNHKMASDQNEKNAMK